MLIPAMAADWMPIAARPDKRVGLDAPEGRHPLTPSTIRRRWAAGDQSGAAAWRLGDVAGIISDHGEVAWSNATGSIVLERLQPAKGSGYLSLAFQPATGPGCRIAFANMYAPELDSWLRALAAALAIVASLNREEKDLGFDT